MISHIHVVVHFIAALPSVNSLSSSIRYRTKICMTSVQYFGPLFCIPFCLYFQYVTMHAILVALKIFPPKGTSRDNTGTHGQQCSLKALRYHLNPVNTSISFINHARDYSHVVRLFCLFCSWRACCMHRFDFQPSTLFTTALQDTTHNGRLRSSACAAKKVREPAILGPDLHLCFIPLRFLLCRLLQR